MRFLLVVVLCLAFSGQGFAGQSPKKACLKTKLSIPFSQFQAVDFAEQVAEKQLKSCTEYLNGFKVGRKPKFSRAIKKLRALLQRAKAHTIMGNKPEALADISEMRKLADAAGVQNKVSHKYGVGLILLAMEAMNSDNPFEQFADITKKFPYYEPLHQIGLSYALEAGEFKVAADYATLSDKLNENAISAQIKGYLLEMSDDPGRALRHYEQSVPSVETLIRTAHLYLQKGGLTASKEAYEKAISTSKDGSVVAKNVYAFLARSDDRGKIQTELHTKRLNILEAVYEIDKRGAEAVYKDLLQTSGQFGHFELISALQYTADRMETKPEQIFDLNSKPQLPEKFSVGKNRNSWLNKFPTVVPSGKSPKKVHPIYSTSIPFMSGTNGFSTDTLEDGAVEVSFGGSLTADRSTIVELTLLRAAEVALKKEKRFFRVRDLNHYSRVLTYNNVATGSTVGYSVKMIIELSDSQKFPAKEFDAEKIRESLAIKYIKQKKKKKKRKRKKWAENKDKRKDK